MKLSKSAIFLIFHNDTWSIIEFVMHTGKVAMQTFININHKHWLTQTLIAFAKFYKVLWAKYEWAKNWPKLDNFLLLMNISKKEDKKLMNVLFQMSEDFTISPWANWNPRLWNFEWMVD